MTDKITSEEKKTKDILKESDPVDFLNVQIDEHDEAMDLPAPMTGDSRVFLKPVLDADGKPTVDKHGKPIFEEEDEEPTFLRCGWCSTTSKDKPFHVGRLTDDKGNQYFNAICPKCTNVFPVLNEHVSESLFAGRLDAIEGDVVMETEIVPYCREHHDAFLFEVKGNVPSTKNALIPEASNRGIPKEHRDEG